MEEEIYEWPAATTFIVIHTRLRALHAIGSRCLIFTKLSVSRLQTKYEYYLKKQNTENQMLASCDIDKLYLSWSLYSFEHL